MCQKARFAAQSPNATRGRSRNDTIARTSRSRAIGPRIRGGSMNIINGPRTATTVRAMPRSLISTCWSMCTQSRWFSPIVSIGEIRPIRMMKMPAPNSPTRVHGARSARPRRRRRNQPCRKRTQASPIAANTAGGAVQTAWARSTGGSLPVAAGSLKPEEARDHHALHLVRALADLEDLLVAVQPRDRELLHEAVAAVDLQRGVHHPVRQQAGVELRLRRRERERLALVLQPRGAVDELAPCFDLGRHVRELELDGLELRDRPAELLSLLRVRERKVVRALGEPDAHRRDGDTAAVDDLHELLEALAALTQQIGLGHAAVLEQQLSCVGRVPAELAHRRRELVALSL